MTSSTPAAEGPIGIAVIGAGYWGPNLVRNIMASPDFRLRWLCDLDVARAQRVLGRYTDVKATADVAEVLADPEVHAVTVVTPAETHLDLALAALRAGKHLLIEKPLASTYEQGRQIVQEAEDRGLTIMVEHTFCYAPVATRLRELMHSGEVGDIQYFDSVRINFGPIRRDVDAVWDLAPHDLSILDHILPDGIHPVAVSAMGSDPIGMGKVSLAYINLTLSNDAIAHIQVNWLSPLKVRKMTIGGSKRTVVWDHLDPMFGLSIYDRGVDVTPEEALPDEERRKLLISFRSGDVVSPTVPTREPLAAVVDEFARALRTKTPALTDGHSGLRMLRILEATSQSIAEHGKTFELDT